MIIKELSEKLKSYIDFYLDVLLSSIEEDEVDG